MGRLKRLWEGIKTADTASSLAEWGWKLLELLFPTAVGVAVIWAASYRDWIWSDYGMFGALVLGILAALIVSLAFFLFALAIEFMRGRPSTSAATTSSTVDSFELSNAVLVWKFDFKTKKLSGASPYFEIRFWVFNGSGLPIQITDQITGNVKLRSPVREEKNIIEGTEETISYPSHGTILLRQYLTEELVKEAREFAEGSAAKALDAIFGANDPPSATVDFSEVRVMAKAIKGNGSVIFPIRLSEFVSLTF